jgi:hypothetical protein
MTSRKTENGPHVTRAWRWRAAFIGISLILSTASVRAENKPAAGTPAPADDSAPSEEKNDQTLFDSGPLEKGGFGGPALKVSTLRGQAETLVGGRGGFIINHAFVVGAAFYGMVGKQERELSGGEMRHLEFGYGGVELEYIWRPTQLVHASALLLVGGGGLSTEGPSDSFFAIDQTIQVEVNLMKWLRVAVGGGYRLVTGVDMVELDNSDVSGAVGMLTLKYGEF